MITSAEIQLIRNADPGALLPGIDTPTGNPDSASSLLSYTAITQNNSAPYYYDPANNTVIVSQNGAVLRGINFGSATVSIQANDVTVEDCTFTATTGEWAIIQRANYSGATVRDCTFQGSGAPSEYNNWIDAVEAITIEDNSFLESPTDSIDFRGGVVTGNYFSGEGFMTGAHADAIWVTDSAAPTIITDNFIDETQTAGEAINPNSDIRVTTEQGPLSTVTVSGNFLLGGNYSVEVSDTGEISNVSITNNYIGFATYAEYYPGSTTDATIAPNTIVGYTNPIYSTQALAAYLKAGVLPTHEIAATTAGQTLSSVSSEPTTLLGEGLATLMNGSTNETNFVGGFASQHLVGGEGANIYTYLAISDSTPLMKDQITNFDPAKDVIDLSRIDANITTPGLQHFTFIGSAPFSGNGAQVRFQVDPALDVTYVEADLAGDAGDITPDFEITLDGQVPLTAANFALTAAQSLADISNGAKLTDANVQTPAGAPGEDAITNVQGRSYSSYESFYGSGWENLAAEDLNLSSTADDFLLYDSGLTVTRGGGSEAFQVGTGAADPLAYHPVETIDATTSGSENFVFATGFGNETILGFQASGTTPDTIQLATSSFSYLTAGMTQAQDLAAVLANASSGPTGLTIADSQGDGLTLAGVSAATIAANPSAIKFA